MMRQLDWRHELSLTVGKEGEDKQAAAITKLPVSSTHSFSKQASKWMGD